MAVLVGGLAKTFHTLDGVWICYLDKDDPHGSHIEFHPKNHVIGADNGVFKFIKYVGKSPDMDKSDDEPFNLAVTASRQMLEHRCKELGLECDWQLSTGLMRIYLEPELPVQLVPEAA